MRANNTGKPNPYSTLSNESNKPSWVGQTPGEFEKSTGNKLLQYSTGDDGKLINRGSMSYQNKGTFENNPLIGGSYNKMVGGYSGGSGGAIAGLASMFGGRIPSPLEFAAQRKAGESGYSSVQQMQIDEEKNRRDMQERIKKQDMEDEKNKTYQNALLSGKKGRFSGAFGSFKI